MKMAGLIIDPQRDFCEPGGALFVTGADADMIRLGAFLERVGSRFDALHVTMDAHHFADIAHPVWWQNEAGQHPAPFTIITAEAVAAGQWRSVRAEYQERSRQYVNALAAEGRYPLCIWPPHCLIGQPGQNLAPAIAEALNAWEAQTGRAVFYVLKGQNPFTEHYSAIRADVPDPVDPATETNHALVESLRQADLVVVAGEAGSHCVANTVRDLLTAWNDPTLARKLVLLTDAVSPVKGFEVYQDDFMRDMAQIGVQTAQTDTFEEQFLK